MLHVDERRHTARLLRFGNYLQRNSSFARRFRSEDFANSAARETAHAQCVVERDGAARYCRNRNDRVLRAETQNRPFAKLFLDLAQSSCQNPATLFFIHGSPFENLRWGIALL